MRTAMALLGALLTAGAATVLVQQQTPDLTGTWMATKDTPPTMAAAPTAVFGARFGLRQEGPRMVVMRSIPNRETAITHTFPLDGTETAVLSQPRPCIGQSGQVISLQWEGDVLRYTIAGTLAPGAVTPTRSTTGFGFRFRMVAPDTLVVETTVRDPATNEIRPGGTVYRRSPDALTPDPPIPAPAMPARIAQVAWIAGDWTAMRGTSQVEERWSPGSGGGMIGTSRTLRGGEVMTEFEFLCISERNGTLVYTAMPNAGTSTDFTLTKIDATSATFENPEHNFPKLIRYEMPADGELVATVAGAPTSKPIVFSFKRKQ